MSKLISRLELGDENHLFKEQVVDEPVKTFQWTLRCRNFSGVKISGRHTNETGIINSLHEHMKRIGFKPAGDVRKGFSVIVFSTEDDLDAYFGEAITSYMIYKLSKE